MLSIRDFIEVPCFKADKPVRNQDLTTIVKHLCSAYDNKSFDGLCLEFGVYQGSTINGLALRDPNTMFYGFDSFEGLPEDWPQREGGTAPKGTYATEMPAVRENVELIKGWFSDTLPDFIRNKVDDVAFLHIDCDLYSSTNTVLEILNDKIVSGTVIVFDELIDFRLVLGGKNHKTYTKFANQEWKALTEWVNKYNRDVQPVSRTEFFQSAVIVRR